MTALSGSQFKPPALPEAMTFARTLNKNRKNNKVGGFRCNHPLYPKIKDYSIIL